MTTEEKVKQALANAKENGHTFEAWGDIQVAQDMQEFDSDLEDVPLEEIVAAVKKLRS